MHNEQWLKRNLWKYQIINFRYVCAHRKRSKVHRQRFVVSPLVIWQRDWKDSPDLKIKANQNNKIRRRRKNKIV